MKKIVVGASSFGAAGEQATNLLAEKGYTLQTNPYGRKMTQEETIEQLQGAVGLLAGLEPLNEEVFAACPDLKAIARIGIGMDNVDVEAAKRHKIKISNTPDGPTYAVAEMAFTALLTIGRQIVPANRNMHQGVWKKSIGFSLLGLRVLLVGYGRIAKKFEELLKPFNVEVLVADPQYPELAKGSFEEQLGRADVVSLHASGRSVILGATQLNAMKKGSVLLNSARGGLVDENALFDALESGHLSAYWGDTFSEEPYTGKLTQCENAILTPHISTYTSLCRSDMEMQAVNHLLGDLADV